MCFIWCFIVLLWVTVLVENYLRKSKQPVFVSGKLCSAPSEAKHPGKIHSERCLFKHTYRPDKIRRIYSMFLSGTFVDFPSQLWITNLKFPGVDCWTCFKAFWYSLWLWTSTSWLKVHQRFFVALRKTMLNQPTMILPSASQELMPSHAHLLLHLQASFPHPIWYRRQHIAVVVDSPCTKSTWQSPRHFGNMAVIDAAMSAFHVSAKLALTGSCWKLLLLFSCFAINITQSCQCASWSW